MRSDDPELDCLYSAELRDVRRRERERKHRAGVVEAPRDTPPICNTSAYNDYEDDLYENRIEIDEVFGLLKSNVYHLDGLRANAEKLKRWLSESEEFATCWRDFTDSRGIDADDFKSFMAGTFRCRLVRRKKHLRLVANNKPRRIRLRTVGRE